MGREFGCELISVCVGLFIAVMERMECSRDIECWEISGRGGGGSLDRILACFVMTCQAFIFINFVKFKTADVSR